MLLLLEGLRGREPFPKADLSHLRPLMSFLSGHLLLEFAGDGAAAHLLTENGVGLVIVDGSGLAAGLPLCQSPELAGKAEADDGVVIHVAWFCHNNNLKFHGAKI